MKKIYTYIGLLFLLLLSVYPSAQEVRAEENEGSATSGNSPVGFYYEVVKPENQRSDAGYFDLRVSPGQQQTVTIKLINTGTVPITINSTLSSARTNANGVIEYGPTPIEKDASVAYDFVDVVKGPESIEVAAGTTADLNFEIAMPEVAFDGVIAGGIQLQVAGDEEGTQVTGTIVNKFAYVVGMLLTETDTEVVPDLAFNSVKVGLNNYRNSVFVNFSNTQAAFLEGMTVSVQLMGEDSDEVLFDKKQANMRMAPNTMIDFPVSMEGERMEPGNYRAHILVTAGEKKWEWTEAYTISQEEADKFNQEDVGLVQEREINWGMIAGIVGAAVALLIVIFVIIRLIGKKKQGKKKKKQQKKK